MYVYIFWISVRVVYDSDCSSGFLKYFEQNYDVTGTILITLLKTKFCTECIAKKTLSVKYNRTPSK